MADASSTPGPGPLDNGGRSASDLAALRRILVGPEQHRLEELESELHERKLTAADVAEHLPEAIMLRGQRDRQIGRALAPTVETALSESIRRNPREIATAIFPVLGPAIATMVTDADGDFETPVLTGGAYVVTFTPAESSGYNGVWVSAVAHSGSHEYPWWIVLPQ